MTDKSARLENAGLENGGQKVQGGVEKDGQN